MQNVYEQRNPENFYALKLLVESKPRGFKQMLEAKGRKREPDIKPKYAHLLKWMNDVLPAKAKELQTKEKCWWILHGLEDFPECCECGKTICSDQFINIVHGYRTYCCIQCVHKSEDHSKHLSDSYKKNLEIDPDFCKKRGEKNKATRMKNNGGTYFSSESLKKRKSTISSDPDFWTRRDMKCKETKVKNGHDPTWNNPKKMVKTRLENNNGSWETEDSLRRRKEHALVKYGVDDASKSEEVKRHKAEAFQRKYGEDVTCWFQTPESREYMKAVNEQRKAKEHETKRKNGTFNTSLAEERAWHMLRFLYPHLMRQYKSEEYPFACDFYDPISKTYIECNFSWTHGGHWFDENDSDDNARLEFMKSKNSKYYDNAIETWTVRDVKKRKCAEENNLKYVVLWTEKEVREYVLDELQKITNKV